MKPARRNRSRSRRLAMETLEARRLLTTFAVSTAIDESDGDYSAGDFSLREALEQAAVSTGHDEIEFDTGLSGQTIFLTVEDFDFDGPTGLLPLEASDVTIRGLGAIDTIIDAQGLGRAFVIGGSQVQLEGLTIRGGFTEYGESGGAIYTAASQLSIVDSVIEDSVSGWRGGGIYAADGVLSISGSTVRNNDADASGGGIAVSESATLVLTDSTVSGNTAGNSGGGGLDLWGISTISDSIIEGNTTSSFGGGISSFNAANNDFSSHLFERITVRDNHAKNGAGIAASQYANVTIVDSSITNNTATSTGGGIRNLLVSDMTIINSTIDNNYAGDSGGGLHQYYFSTMSLINSTVSGNHVGGGEEAKGGGGIRSHTSSTVSLINSTVAENSVADGLSGGGIHSGGRFSDGDPTSMISVSNSIVAANVLEGAGGGADLFFEDVDESELIDALSSQSSLIGVGDGTGLVDGVDGNLVGTSSIPLDPQLGPLADNGGFTLTHALLEGSPAIDAGDVVLIAADIADIDGDGDTSESIPFDQRGAGFQRIGGTHVDMGAVELQAVAAGNNVTAEVIDHPQYGRVLIINGDDLGNEILILGGSEGNVLVLGRDGTLVNGGTVAGFDYVRHVQLNLAGGDDSATVDGLSIRGRLEINSGSGNDSVMLDDLSIRGRLAINSGSGNDTIVVRRSAVNSLRADTGCGNDSIQLEDMSVARQTQIALGWGDDDLTVIDSAFGGNAVADGGPGDDLLTLLGENLFYGTKKAKNFERRG